MPKIIKYPAIMLAVLVAVAAAVLALQKPVPPRSEFPSVSGKLISAADDGNMFARLDEEREKLRLAAEKEEKEAVSARADADSPAADKPQTSAGTADGNPGAVSAVGAAEEKPAGLDGLEQKNAGAEGEKGTEPLMESAVSPTGEAGAQQDSAPSGGPAGASEAAAAPAADKDKNADQAGTSGIAVTDAGTAGTADENKGSGHTGALESAGQGDAVPDAGIAGAADENKGSGHTGAPESAGQGDAVPDVGTAGAADENKGAGQTGAPETDGEDKTKAAGSGTDDGKTAPAPNAEAKQPQQKKDADGAARKPDPKNAVTAARAYMEGDVIHMRILASSPIASTVFSLKTPPRVVIDLDKPRTVSGVRNDAASEVKSIRYAEHGGKTRIVLDLVKAPGKVSRRNIERNIIEVTILP